MGEGEIDTQTGIRVRVDATTAAGQARPGPAREPARQFGRYVVLERLGAGGMGEVFAAWDPELERRVALKRLAIGEGSEGRSARLLREAQAMARLRHPHVVAVHDVGRLQGEVFVAMEYVAGKNLRQWVHDDAPSWPRIVEVYVQAARGLAAAHAEGLVHRDFKPDNAMIDALGRVQVLDFGLAAASRLAEDEGGTQRDDAPEDATSLERLTITGSVLGTPAYMSPEQFGAAPTDPRTDQFSWAVAFFEALYGQRPFAGDTWAELAGNVVDGRIREPPSTRDVPRAVDAVLRRALARRPEDRFASMDAAVDALRQATAPRSRRWIGLVGLGIVAAGLGAMAWTTTATADPCADAASPVTSVWNAPRRARLASTFGTVGLPFASQAWDRTSATLDGYATELADGYTTTCRATHVERTQSEAVLDRRRVCLDRHTADLDALLDVLARGDEVVVEHALEAAEGLLPIAECTTSATLLGEAAVATGDPSRVLEIRHMVSEARAQRLAGEDARETIAPALVAAHELDDPVVLAEVLVEASAIEHDAEEVASASTHAAQAHQLAVEHDIAHVLTPAVLARVTAAISEERYAIADQWAELAIAHARRLGRLDQLAVLQAKRGLIAADQGRYEDAIVLYESALESFETRVGRGGTVARNTLGNLGVAYLRAGRLDDAERALRATLEQTSAEMGEDHPLVAQALQNLATYAVARGDLARARVLLGRALAIRERVYGKEDPRTAEVVEGVGRVEYAAGEYARAEALFQRAVDIVVATRGERTLVASLIRNNLAGSQLQQGKHEAALENLRLAHATKLELLAPDHPDVVLSHANLADVLLARARWDEARAHLEVARDARTQEPQPRQVRRRLEARGALAFLDALAGERESARRQAAAVLANDETDPYGRAYALAAEALVAEPSSAARVDAAIVATPERLDWLRELLTERRGAP